MEEAKSNHKLLICVRHGERSDFAGLTPKLHKFDPELTEKGKKQASEIGKIINHSLNKIYKIDQEKKILILASPFARTLQTAKEILLSINEEQKENKIFVKHLLCEFINYEFYGNQPKDFLTLYHNRNCIDEEIKNVEIEFIDEKELLPTYEEDEHCLERMSKCVDIAIEKHLGREDVGAVILVSHASPIDFINQVLGYKGPFGWSYIKYCSSYVYSVDVENKKTKYLERLDLIKEK